MKPLLAIAVAVLLLAQAAPVMAQQGGDPFGPLAPSEPTTPPEAPEPAEPPSEDDGDLGMAASLGLAAIAAVLVGAVFVAVTREGRRPRRARGAPKPNGGEPRYVSPMPLSFGVTVLPDPPYQRFLDLLVLAEGQGFEYGWTYDSHVLWQESTPTLALAAKATEKMKLGHMVTNPGT